MNDFDLKEIEFATNNFSPSRIIGKGSHGSVYLGVLRNGTTVAIKKQSSGLEKLRDDSKLENEAKVIQSLTTTKTNNIINLLGISNDHSNNKIILVLQHMPNGTLHDVLYNSNPPPSWPRRLQIALHLARAVRFLHEADPVVVHRDIKPSNVLFDRDWKAKLADFGLAVTLDNSKVQSNILPAAAGTMGYLDPEYTSPNKLSTKVDVFSFGVTLLELLSGRKAMDVERTPAWIVEWAVGLMERCRGIEIIDDRVRVPRYMEGLIEKMVGLAIRCVSVDENRRPSMGEVVAELEGLVVVVEEPVVVRFPVLVLNCLREVVVSLKRRRLGATMMRKCGVEGAVGGGGGGACDGGGGGVAKGTLLFREILADLTLK